MPRPTPASFKTQQIETLLHSLVHLILAGEQTLQQAPRSGTGSRWLRVEIEKARKVIEETRPG